jgi:hypothetical protein
MSAFVIAPEEEDGIRVPDLERPEVENTLRSGLDKGPRLGRSAHTSMLKYPLST